MLCRLCFLYTYPNHLDQAQLQLTREPRDLPVMKVNPEVKELLEFKLEDFELVDYDPQPHIKAAISI